MAVYGVTDYGTDVYGLSLPPAYMVDPFVAESIDYGTIQLTWVKPSGVIFRYRLLTNRFGYPVDQNDGNLVMDSLTYPGNIYQDTAVIPGSWHYYAFFCLADEVNDIWICGGKTAVLAIQDFGSAWLMWDKIPEHFKTVPDSGGEISGDASGLPYLAQFLNVLGWSLDGIHTQYSNLAATLNDPMLCSIKDLWNMAAQLGLSFSPAVPAYTVRKAVQNWAHICRERGTLIGLRNEIDVRTGWGADLQLGWNILLENDQSLFLSAVFLPYTPTRYYLVEEIIWFGPGLEYPNWWNGQWQGGGYWYKCVQECQGIEPVVGVTTEYWEVVVDQNDFTGSLISTSTGNPSSWEVVAPALPNWSLPYGALTRGIGVKHHDGIGNAWNSLRCINTSPAPCNLQVRSISRATSDLSQMPDPSFEAGFTIIPADTICDPDDWWPSHWPRFMFFMDGYPGQRHAPQQYNAAAFWTPTNCALTRSQAAAHTGTWGVLVTPSPTSTPNQASSWSWDSPWVSVQDSEECTASVWLKAPAGLSGQAPPVVGVSQLLPDPDFNSGTGGFTDITGCTVAWTTAAVLAGQVHGITVTIPASTSPLDQYGFSNELGWQVNSPSMPVVAGLSYTGSFWISSPATTGGGITLVWSIQWYNSTGGTISSVAGPSVTLTTAYKQCVVTGTAPASATSAQFILVGTSTVVTSASSIAWEICQGSMINAAVTPVTPTVPVTPVIVFGDQDGAIPLQVTGTPVVLAPGAWTQVTVSGEAPVDGYAWMELVVNGGAATDTSGNPIDILQMDDVAITTGATPPDVPDPALVLADGIDVPWVRDSEAWDPAVRYATGALALYNGQAFQALRASTGIAPPLSDVASAEWTPLSENRRIRLLVSGYVSQNMTITSTEEYAVVPYVEWFDQNGNFITRVLARNGTTGGVLGKPPGIVFDSFTGPSRVLNESISTPVLGPWVATFYANEDLVEPAACQRVDQSILFSWGGNPPAPCVGTTGWSASWVTTFTPSVTGIYTFTMQGTGGGSRLLVGNQPVINNWTSMLGTLTTGSVELNAGTPVQVELDFTIPLEVFVTTYEISVVEDFDPFWLFFPDRFCNWTTEPFECIAGYPFRMQCFPGGERSRGQCTWYCDDEPIAVTEITTVTEYINGFPVLQIVDVVPEGCNFGRFWCEEDGDRWWGFDFGWLGRHQYFQQQYTTITEQPEFNFSAPVPFVEVGTTQYTQSLSGRFTDDDMNSWTVPTGAFAVGDFADGSTWPLTPGTRSIGLIQGLANTQVGVTIRSNPVGGQSMGVIFRYSANNSYWRCDQTALRKNVAGTWTTVAVHSAPFAPGDRMVVTLNGSAIDVYRNAGPVPVSAATDAFNSSASLHGVIVEAT